MKTSSRITWTHIRHLAILAVCSGLVVLTMLEFGNTPMRSTICSAVYPRTPPYTVALGELAPILNASTLIASILSQRTGRTAAPAVASSKIIHQSWHNGDPPPVYHPFMNSWRSTYPDWVYILWDNNDNLALVETFYPEWRSAYDALPSDIYRAEFARNVYMYIFGGIYADLDSEAITTLRPLLDAQANSGEKAKPIAFLGRMETHSHELHAIPNAFMAASAPGHPLWLVAAQDAIGWSRARSWDRSVPTPGPEYITGPVSLRRSLMNYAPPFLDPTSVSGNQPLDPASLNSTLAPVILFPSEVIYPFSWDRNRPQFLSAAQECVCWMKMPTFNPGACKRMTGAQWVINYWKHSW